MTEYRVDGAGGVPSSTRPRRRGRRLAAALVGTAVLSTCAVGTAGAETSTGDHADFVVRHAPGQRAAAEAAVDRMGGSVGRRLAVIDGFAADLPVDHVDDLFATGAVTEVTPDAKVHLLGDEWTPDKDMGSLHVSAKGYGVHDAFGKSDSEGRRITGEGVGIAVIDSGIVPVKGLDDPARVTNGPDLSFESQSADLAHLDTFGHGTHIAGIIAGRDPEVKRGSEKDSKHFVGIAPRANLLNMKVASSDGATDVSQVIAAVDWVVAHRNDEGMNIRVINLSFGTQPMQSYVLDPLAHAVEVAWRKGIVVVVSAGNDGPETDSLTNPAMDPYVLAVGASDHNGTEAKKDDVVASFSNRGSVTRTPDLVAPGRSIVSLRAPESHIDQTHWLGRVDAQGAHADRFFRGSGTSQSAAFVSGVAALVLQKHPQATPDQVKALLTSTADPISGVDPRLQGAGLIDVKEAIEASGLRRRWVQTHAPSTGLGSLELARGGEHVADPDTGEELTGEVDIFGDTWDGRTWSQDAWEGRTWSGGDWRGRTWSGRTWSGTSWAGRTWSSEAWAGTNWSGRTWSGRTWSGNVWDGRTWSGRTWSGRTWSGRTWSGRTWSAQTWPLELLR